MYLCPIMILMKYYSIKACCSSVHRCHDYKRFARGGLMHFYVFTFGQETIICIKITAITSNKEDHLDDKFDNAYLF